MESLSKTFDNASKVANAFYDLSLIFIEKFDGLQNETLLMNQDIIELNAGDWDTKFAIEDSESVAINFDYILKAGEIPQKFSGKKWDQPNQHIDWKSDDALTRAITDIRENVKDRIHNTPELQELLDKDIWERSDRVTWEKGISEIVSKETAKIPGLEKYRTVENSNPDKNAAYRITRINDLSEDIEKDSAHIEYDCEMMSVIEGSILQQTEKDILRPHGFGADHKEASNYFYIKAAVTTNRVNPIGGHAFIASSMTGNIIEATRINSVYRENINPDHNFSDFIKTGISLQEDNSVYVSSNGYSDGNKGAFEKTIEARLEEGLHIDTDIYKTIEKNGWQPVNGTETTAEDGALTLLYVPPKGLEFLQKQMLQEDGGFPESITIENREIPIVTALKNHGVFETMKNNLEENGNKDQLETMDKFLRLQKIKFIRNSYEQSMPKQELDNVATKEEKPEDLKI